ncbi:hypothetical protein BS47DRAFT_1360424 [Hydnum rufescens UP504]|uniref:Uncharacterized protein n=1 Tax=Hydnum rufescens UP504 TaxID=1448309 RepID=A0A9P6B2K7_9AGAM|nr:hypothetical protein BS47DRAFT_1360424 [Hydnum rufescens UP504]
MYQFLMVWTKFAPAQYNTTYFVYEEELQEWHMDQELLITVQTGIERLQNIISDVITIVGSEDHRFVIDCEGKLAEQLWMSKHIEELKMADKLLRLQVELTFTQLYKLKKLHQGESLSMPTASKDSLPPTPKLKECLHKAWHDPRCKQESPKRLCHSPRLLNQGQKERAMESIRRLRNHTDGSPLESMNNTRYGLEITLVPTAVLQDFRD